MPFYVVCKGNQNHQKSIFIDGGGIDMTSVINLALPDTSLAKVAPPEAECGKYTTRASSLNYPIESYYII